MLLIITGETWTQKPEYEPQGLYIQSTEVMSEAGGFDEVERIDAETLIWKIHYAAGAWLKVAGKVLVRMVQKEDKNWFALVRVKDSEGSSWDEIPVPAFQP